ncbi:predicted dithiol-disulfide isomerase involved in polyketide biosynthesis [Chthonomonas calidirosea]|uniref:DsbA family oxidoreductase n=1 Tax=Chthonomonas calidirosea TaxID=454171 RepID=UPI0006DD4A8E|nr:DsbA family protein [Chthonomonas calidirosea]CEK17194.1 predicted dithiol-disulfide isomerase involved in polyketide biosynthesis [Chthonomonas calidirosea]
MPVLSVAHDVVCPWCWVGRHQAKRLKQEFPTLEFNWLGFELLPEGLTYTPPPPDPDADKKPPVPTRLELLLAAEGLTLPQKRKPISNSRLALEGAEFAKEQGRIEPYLDALYYTYWEEDEDIADRDVLREIARRADLDVHAFDRCLDERRYRDRIVEFDEPAHRAGVWNVPTWMFPEKWVAEQPYRVLREMAARFVAEATTPAR